MTLEQFSDFKEQVQKDLNRKLKLSQDARCATYHIAMQDKEQSFTLQDNMEGQLELLKEVIAFAEKVQGTVSHSPKEDSRGRVGYYSHTIFTVSYKEVMAEITEEKVKETVKKALKGMMGLSRYSYIDCKLMQLFKEGKLSWEDLVKAHKTDCSL